MVVAKETEPHAQIDRYAWRNLPIVLYKRLGNPITVVVAELGAILVEFLDGIGAAEESGAAIVVQKVGECVAGAKIAAVLVAESQHTLQVARGCSQRAIRLVLLCKHELRTQLESMFAPNFGYIVARIKSGIGVFPGIY